MHGNIVAAVAAKAAVAVEAVEAVERFATRYYRVDRVDGVERVGTTAIHGAAGQHLTPAIVHLKEEEEEEEDCHCSLRRRPEQGVDRTATREC